MIQRFSFFIILFCNQLICSGQSLPAEIITKINCRLNEGIYLEYSQFKSNTPLPFTSIATEGNPENHNTIISYLSHRNVYSIDSIANYKKIKTSTIWGYCYHCSVYINVGNKFYLLPAINTLSLIPEKVPEARYRSMVESIDETKNNEDNYFQTYENIEVIIDMRTGKLHRFDPIELEKLFDTDTELTNKYSSLSRRKQKRRKIEYLNLFNQRNPLNLHKENTN
ncbi:MAG TPA: hypothetical protein PL017_04455 [Tenuifilaceae bacterium]|nr:hypothetical protein [Tenuifilaceae bacterium]HPE17850.1 hypothetical protein [Tenuifilaceae bacterium]HPJ45326.1 hypothetical protein [Tenuifilaceae bacterium]HPQ33567.1 hypothetical protein [Tenuifilaceae bacterium]HRX67419.1 hypothetical protein [Tenuifilaceae bacterium]